MALGMLLVIVAGDIDLSVGSVAGFIGALAAVMIVRWHVDFRIAMFLCLVVGGVIGAAQGYWIAYHKIPSFIVTLAGMFVFRGLTLALLGGDSIACLLQGFAKRADYHGRLDRSFCFHYGFSKGKVSLETVLNTLNERTGTEWTAW
jgi:ABC-type xylose transport system permease subunit